MTSRVIIDSEHRSCFSLHANVLEATAEHFKCHFVRQNFHSVGKPTMHLLKETKQTPWACSISFLWRMERTQRIRWEHGLLHSKPARALTSELTIKPRLRCRRVQSMYSHMTSWTSRPFPQIRNKRLRRLVCVRQPSCKYWLLLTIWHKSCYWTRPVLIQLGSRDHPIPTHFPPIYTDWNTRRHQFNVSRITQTRVISEHKHQSSAHAMWIRHEQNMTTYTNLYQPIPAWVLGRLIVLTAINFSYRYLMPLALFCFAHKAEAVEWLTSRLQSIALSSWSTCHGFGFGL